MRFATVTNATSREHLAAYLPDNYSVLGQTEDETAFIIGGEDRAGWTMEDYVIPRAASGLIWATEILTEGEPQVFGREALVLFSGGLVALTANDSTRLHLKTVERSEVSAPVVNGIPVYFRLNLRVINEIWHLDDAYVDRVDQPYADATDAQRRKIIEWAKALTSKLPARMFLAGEIRSVEFEIQADERLLSRLEREADEARARIRQAQMRRDTLLVS